MPRLGERKAVKTAKSLAKTPLWLARLEAVATSVNTRAYKTSRLGTFGAASPVRKVDPKDYKPQ